MSSEISSQIIEKIIAKELEDHIETSKLLYELIPDINSFTQKILFALRNKNKIMF